MGLKIFYGAPTLATHVSMYTTQIKKKITRNPECMYSIISEVLFLAQDVTIYNTKVAQHCREAESVTYSLW